MDRTTAASVLFGAAGGLVTTLVVWALASRALDRQLATGAERLGAALSEGTTTMERRLREGEAQVERMVRQELAAQVPSLVRSTMDATLRSYGLTPATGAQIATILQRAEDVGLLGFGATSRVVTRYR